MLYVGIDPGQSGALAVLGDEFECPIVIPFDRCEYISILSKISAKESIVCLEYVTSMPGQGVKSMFSFGENFGFIKGVLEALQVPYELVRPQKWKRAFSVTSDKNMSIDVCQRLFPGVYLKRSEKCRRDDDGMAEALLMAEYARRVLYRKNGGGF